MDNPSFDFAHNEIEFQCSLAQLDEVAKEYRQALLDHDWQAAYDLLTRLGGLEEVLHQRRLKTMNGVLAELARRAAL